MKAITIILSFLMLSIVLKPCSDGFNEDHDALEVVGQEDHDHSSDHDDSCSSLCVCNCCGVSVTAVDFLFFEYTPPFRPIEKVESIYKSAYRFDFHSSIWQPPRLIA